MPKHHKFLKNIKKPRPQRPPRTVQEGNVVGFSVAPVISSAENLIDQGVGGVDSVFFRKAMERDYLHELYRTKIQQMEKIIDWGFGQHRYLGGGNILSINWQEVDDVYFEVLSKLGISVSDAMCLKFPRINNHTKHQFWKIFRKLYRELISVNSDVVDSLFSAKFTYSDSTEVLIDGLKKVATIHWRADGTFHAFSFAVTPRHSFHGLLSAFECYMKDGAIAAAYCTPLITRYDLDKNLIPSDELHLILEHDLGL